MDLCRREKLALDMLGAAGAVTLNSQWIRLFVNGQPFGLFLMTDEATTHFIENAIYAGDHDRTNTGMLAIKNVNNDANGPIYVCRANLQDEFFECYSTRQPCLSRR